MPMLADEQSQSLLRVKFSRFKVFKQNKLNKVTFLKYGVGYSGTAPISGNVTFLVVCTGNFYGGAAVEQERN